MIELLLDFKTNETRDILSQLQLLAVLGAFLDLIPTLLPGVLQKVYLLLYIGIHTYSVSFLHM